MIGKIPEWAMAEAWKVWNDYSNPNTGWLQTECIARALPLKYQETDND